MNGNESDTPRGEDLGSPSAGLPAGVLPVGVVAVPPLIAPSDRGAQFEEEFRDVQRVGVFYAAMLLPILAAAGWSYHARSDAVEIEFWAGGMLYAAIAVFATIWRRDWLHLVRLPTDFSWRWLLPAGLTPVATVVAAELLCRWVRGLGLPVREVTAGFGTQGYPIWVLTLSIVGFAPFFEEIAFRGVMLAKLQRLMRPTQAIWVSATLFGVLHFSVLSMAVFLVPLAAFAGYLTRRTQSLFPALALHAAHNAGVLVLSLWLD